MEEKFGGCPPLLDLISRERNWMAEENGRERNGFGVREERKLELKLGLPLGEDEDSDEWSGSKEKNEQKKQSMNSVLSLGYSTTTTTTNNNNNNNKLAKRVFLSSVQTNIEGNGVERKPSGPLIAHVASTVNTSMANNSSQTRTTAPVVGWPPVRSFRKNLASSSKPSIETENGSSSGTGTKSENNKKGLFVKINMDGIPIGRKVDLKAYDSYEKLSFAVDQLFWGLLAAQMNPVSAGAKKNNVKDKQTTSGILDQTGEYTLVYEDEEGDRMLVGDVPWEMFVSTAKRLRVLKTCDLPVSSLSTVSRKRTASDHC